MIAKIVVNVSSSNVDQTYDYKIPSEMVSFAKVGSRVKVGFGPSDRVVMGFIMELRDEPTYEGSLKDVIEVVDYEPVLTKMQLELAKKIRDDAICPLIRILNQMIPNALVLKTTKYLTIKNYQAVDASIAQLFKDNEKIPYQNSLKSYDSKIAKEVANNNIEVSYQANQLCTDHYVKKYLINPTNAYKYINDLRSKKQKDLILNLQNEIALTMDEITEKYGTSRAIVLALVKNGYLDVINEVASRIKIREIPIDKKIRQSKDETVVQLLNSLDTANKPILFIPKDNTQQIDSIIQIINKYQKKQQNVLIITPEILSSYQIENIIRKKTGLSIAPINSKLSDGEYYDYYKEIKKGNYPVVVTTPVGALLPYNNIGAIIMLNTDSDNYYNDQSPRYNLKKVMIDYASLLGSRVILTSFAPNITDYSYGLKNYYQIIESIERKELPVVHVVDLKQELRNGNNSPISQKLLIEILKAKKANKVSILIVNNKSYSSYVMCRSCGKTITCPRCNISLQYNKKNNLLICPACSYRVAFTNECPTCSSKELKFGGFGMEQINEELNTNYPSIRTAILNESNYDDYYQIMLGLEEETIDVIITTSVLANKIDSDRIGMVGIINLDSVAKIPTYDANERAYEMLTYAKECLNSSEDSLVIQAYSLDEIYLKTFLLNDYHAFIKEELSVRKILKNEPFYYINRIFIKAKYDLMYKEANEIKKYLQSMLGKEVYVIGPTYNHQHQMVQIIVKHRINDIGEIYKKIYEKYQTTTVTIIIDRYPKYI